MNDSVSKDGPAKGGVLASIITDGASRAGWQSAASGRGGRDGAPRCKVMLRVTKKYLEEQLMFF